MNIFWREIKVHKYSSIGWSIGMVLLILSSMAKYDAYQGNGQSMNELVKQFPKTFLTVFGVGGFDLSKASGYFGLIFLYIALMAAIHAVLTGSNIIAKEEEERTSEFLFAKPVSRSWVISFKLLAALVNILILNLVTLITSLKIVPIYAKGESVSHEIILMISALLFIQLIFMAVGSSLAGLSGRPKTVSGLATSILLVTYVIYIIININDKLLSLKYFSPFKYFDAKDLLADNKLDPAYISLSIAIFLSLMVCTFITYDRRDLNV